MTRSTAGARTRGWTTRPARVWLPAAFVGVLALALGCTSTSTDVFSLQVGDCFQDPDTSEDEIHAVETVDCAEPHDNEVYAVFDLPDGGFPGPDAIAEASLEGCLDRFEEFVGTPYPESELFATWLYPTETSWAEDDREVVCVLFAQEGGLEGSMEGSGR
jgi:hypothetical protein